MTITAIRWARIGRSHLDHLILDEERQLAACGLKIPAGAVYSNVAHRACHVCEARHPARADLIERVLDYMMQSPLFRTAGSSNRRAANDLTAWDFDGAEPLVDTALTHSFDDRVPLSEPADVPWPVDVRWLTNLGDPGPDGILPLYRFRGLRPSEIRGRFAPALPFASELALANPHTGEGYRFYVGRLGPRRWTILSQAHAEGRSVAVDLAEASQRAPVAIGMAKANLSRWRVYLGLDDRPGITLPTTPEGAQEVFRLRDIPPGKDRRAALRHWVESFWRASPSDPDTEHLVRAHLRGKEEFAWNGLRGRIMPSFVDRVRDATAKLERAEAHRTGTDKRVRGR